ELHVELPKDDDQHQLIKGLTQALLGFAGQGQSVVVCLDEAQAMPVESLEALRLLTNLETEKRKLLQVVLFGQPELDEKLARPEIRQLRQRITFEHRMAPLTSAETAHYLAHRLIVAGYSGGGVFSGSATRALHRASGGVPRLVNILEHKTLMLAYGRGVRCVRWRDARAAVRDTSAAAAAPRRALAWLGLAGMAGLVAGGGWLRGWLP